LRGGAQAHAHDRADAHRNAVGHGDAADRDGDQNEDEHANRHRDRSHSQQNEDANPCIIANAERQADGSGHVHDRYADTDALPDAEPRSRRSLHRRL
jgi:hypothetical protein